MPSIQSTQKVPTETVNEQLIWKIEAQLSTLKILVNCEVSIIRKRHNTFSDSLNHLKTSTNFLVKNQQDIVAQIAMLIFH